ncbi:FAD-dependent monooxygenase [Acetobacteraceae bacterium H6797]|nr:FAD-dependent monooxygenase [Acetobacteraceae bacterium H6797]
MRIGVIGAGVAGSLVVDALRKAPGVSVKGFERVARGGHEEAGTGLNVGPNAMKALRLHAPEAHDRLRAVSLPWESWFIDMVDGTRVFDIQLSQVAEEPGIRLAWAELYRQLRTPVNDHFAFQHTLVALEEDAAGRLVPVFKTGAGETVRDGGFDLLIAGDGRYSALRMATIGPLEVEFMGVGMWRLLVPDASDCPYQDYGQWFHRNNRLLSYRLPGGAAYIAGSFGLETPDGEILPEHRTAQYQRSLFDPDEGAPCAAVAWMQKQIEPLFDDIHWARLQVSPLEREAANGRVLFLGDSAHAMVPTLGQGATQAIEDGTIAGTILARGGSLADIGKARNERVSFVRQFSADASDTILPGTDAAEGSREKMGPAFMAKLRRLYTDVPGPDDLI